MPQGTPHHEIEIESLYNTPNVSYKDHLARDNMPPSSIRVLTSIDPLGNSQGIGYLAHDGGPFDAEVSADDPVSANFRVEITVGHGRISLTRAADRAGRIEVERQQSVLDELFFKDGDGVSDARLVFHGPLSAVNRAIKSVIYTPDRIGIPTFHRYGRAGSGLEEISSQSRTRRNSRQDLVGRMVPSNDPPVISVPEPPLMSILVQ